jgi:hypothetical protein
MGILTMSAVLLFPIIFLYTAVLWVVVLVIYSTFVESFDFGVLSTFAWKSVILIAIVAAVETFVDYGGWFAVFIWALGLLVLFRKDLWEMRILIVMIWVSNLVVGWIIRLMTLRLWEAYNS